MDMTRRGVLTFMYADRPRPMEVHVFHASQYTGQPVESEEMRPQWFSLDEPLPFDQMWPDDIHWYPLFLAGKKFAGTFEFTNGVDDETETTTLLRHDLREVEAL